MSTLPRPTGKELVRALERAGFAAERIRGSHYFVRHPDGRATVVTTPDLMCACAAEPDVAIKVLPAAFASDPDRMARFQREAEVLAIRKQFP